jgi:hypothetical protein
MSTIISGPAIRTSQFGIQLIKGPSALPQTQTAVTLATITGGSVLITSMLGLVTTVLGAGANNLTVGTVPTIGAASANGIMAATLITAAPVGSWIGLVQSAGTGSAGAVGANAGATVFLTTPFVVAAGTITWGCTANITGAIKWYFTYIALDNGAGMS